MTVKELAEHNGVTERTVRNWLADGEVEPDMLEKSAHGKPTALYNPDNVKSKCGDLTLYISHYPELQANLDDLMTIQQLTVEFGKTEKQIRRWIAEGAIEPVATVPNSHGRPTLYYDPNELEQTTDDNGVTETRQRYSVYALGRMVKEATLTREGRTALALSIDTMRFYKGDINKEQLLHKIEADPEVAALVMQLQYEKGFAQEQAESVNKLCIEAYHNEDCAKRDRMDLLRRMPKHLLSDYEKDLIDPKYDDWNMHVRKTMGLM